MGTLLEQYTRAVSEFDDRLQKVSDDEWSRPTPCREWDVRALVAHVVDAQRWAPYLLAGGRREEAADRFTLDPLGDDPKGAWFRASTQACDAFAVPGALERHVWGPDGELSARDYLWQLAVNLAIHAWDLARAIRADDRLNPELVRRIAAEVEKNLDDMASSGRFDRPVSVPAGADLQARTLAMFGRRTSPVGGG